jgi:hypothetical protein
VVNDVFSEIRDGVDCCADGGSINCNMQWALDVVLNTAGHLAQSAQATVAFADLTQELLAHRPIAVRVMFADLTAHFVVVVGCDEGVDGTQWVRVADPSGATGNVSTITYAALVNGYRPGAMWDQTYYTC